MVIFPLLQVIYFTLQILLYWRHFSTTQMVSMFQFCLLVSLSPNNICSFILICANLVCSIGLQTLLYLSFALHGLAVLYQYNGLGRLAQLPLVTCFSEAAVEKSEKVAEMHPSARRHITCIVKLLHHKTEKLLGTTFMPKQSLTH